MKKASPVTCLGTACWLRGQRTYAYILSLARAGLTGQQLKLRLVGCYWQERLCWAPYACAPETKCLFSQWGDICMIWVQEVSSEHWIMFARQGAVMPTEWVKVSVSWAASALLQTMRSTVVSKHARQIHLILWHQLTSPSALSSLALANAHQRRLN